MSRGVRKPLLAAIACAAAIVPLAYAAYHFAPLSELDLRTILHFEYQAGAAHSVGSVLVHLGDLGSLLVLCAIVVGIGLYLERPRQTVAAMVVIAGSNLSTQALKGLLEHTRHLPWEPGVEISYTKSFPSPDSFPSGHTTAVASVAVALLFVVPAAHRLTAAAAGLLLTGVVGISVVALDWHYPSDVVGALLVVAAWAFAVVAALRVGPLRRRVVDGSRSIPGVPVA